MRVPTFYRCAVWLPLLVPAGTAFVVHVLGLHPTFQPILKFVQLLLISGVYGGVPYLVLAVYASWWIDNRSERLIRRRALQAPLWMIALWTPVAAVVGILYGRLDTFAGLVGVGVLFIVPLGYAYVAVVLLLRTAMSRFGWLPNRE